MRLARTSVIVFVLLVLVGAGLYFALRENGQDAKGPREAVQTIKSGLAERKSVPVTIHANGYVTALNTVEVRPQVQNVVRAVHVREGQDVQAGQLLFSLDPRGDQSSVAQARAELARSQAELADAEAALKRNQELLEKKFVSQAVVDAARSRAEALRSSTKAGEAAVQSSSVSLGYNQIRASISGRIGAINVHPGSLVQPGATPIVTIAQIDPITVSFTVPERELAHIVASYPQGGAPVQAQLSNGKQISGKLIFIDNAADQQSGAIRMKAQFDNRDRTMWPGMFVNVELVSRTIPDAVVVPAQAVVTGPVDAAVYVVTPDSKVEQKKIEVMNVIQDGQAVVSGIAPGTRVVVEGTQNLRPGVRIKEAQAAQSDAPTSAPSPGH
jgi:RND family efflux transporter MFP subunit